MPVFDARDMLALPGGDNSTDVVFGDIHFNRTTLEHWNYTLYSNGTLSNNSWCMLVFDPYIPKLLYPNGTFVNSTSCWTALNPVGPRAKIGLAFAACFVLTLLGAVISLAKHGKLYLPSEKRFRPIGRRWQWYWGIATSATAIISLFTNIDVDRYYLPHLPLILNVFFWFLMQITTMALVWEAVRHWGSWMERQFIDPNPFILPQTDRRARFELLLPLWFYLWLWLDFFLVIPRNWGNIEKQRDPAQTEAIAKPSATDSRFKAGAFCLLVCWLTICVSMRHSIKHYQPRNRGIVNRTVGFLRFTPLRFLLLLPLSLATVAYQALAAWEFQWSPLNVHTDHTAMYAGGYAPHLLILAIQIILHGALTPNEDRELLRQRRARGEQIDRELGIVRKPAWWRRLNGEVYEGEGMRDRIARNVRELGGGRATARHIDRNLEAQAANREREEREREAGGGGGGAVEMGALRRTASVASNNTTATAASQRGGGPMASSYGGKSDRRRTERTLQVASGMLFPNAAAASAAAAAERESFITQDGPPPPPYQDGVSGRGRPAEQGRLGTGRPTTAERSTSTGTTGSLQGPPQQVRSMLDV